MKGLPTEFWGKLYRNKVDAESYWHPLSYHCADVAAVVVAFLEHTILGERLAYIAGVKRLSESQCSRLGVLAALHDLGKFNIGFQNKAFSDRQPKLGHVGELLQLLNTECEERANLVDAAKLMEMTRWFTNSSNLEYYLLAIFAHHGKPVAPGGLITSMTSHWRPAHGLDPMAGVASLVSDIHKWFPSAFEAGGTLPSKPPFIHAFNGLLTLADWIASSERFFPFSDSLESDRMPVARYLAVETLEKMGLSVAPYRHLLGQVPPGFDRISPYSPWRMQALSLDQPIDERGDLVILESDTGSGKTEAALARFLRLFHAGRVDGLYFALPTRTSATQLHGRLVEAMARMFEHEDARPSVTLAVPGYLAVDDVSGRHLPDFKVLWDDDDKSRYQYRGWAAEHPKRYLTGSIVVGTVDQALMSSLMIRHTHMRATALMRQLLIVDEVHASDAYMTRILEAVVKRQLAAGGHVLLMSATLGNVAAARYTGQHAPLDEASQKPYPALTYKSKDRCDITHGADPARPAKHVSVNLMDSIESPESIAYEALNAARSGAATLVIRNTVKDCIETQIALEQLASGEDREVLFRCEGVVTPHHSRYCKEDRQLMDAAVEAAFGKQRKPGGRVLVATQTVEQSLDIDADYILSDLCPMDVLLQRVGRLHRHERDRRPGGYEKPAICVLTPESRDMSNLLANPRKGEKRPGGLSTVYDNVLALEATWRQLESRTVLEIPSMNRELVENTTHPEALEALSKKLGEKWQHHLDDVEGLELANGLTASDCLTDWSKPYGERPFPNIEESGKIATRLGLDDRIAEFAQAQRTPFGRHTKQVIIPGKYFRGATYSDTSPTDINRDTNTLSFSYMEKRFLYDRLGLRPDDDGKEA